MNNDATWLIDNSWVRFLISVTVRHICYLVNKTDIDWSFWYRGIAEATIQNNLKATDYKIGNRLHIGLHLTKKVDKSPYALGR